MVPDFNELRKQSRDRTEQQSLKLTSDQSSRQSKNFQRNSERGNSQTEKRTHRPPPPTPKKKNTDDFRYVEDPLHDFLSLWPHRYDFLYAPHPDPGKKPDWKTESRHPLADRLILQGSYLYGVRVGPNTAYALLDVDAGSPYHPRRDPLAIPRICEVLEPLGLVQHLTLTSSGSKGLHLYFPCAEEMPSWQLALAISTLLENAGFKIMSGWLEVFPNRKPFVPDGDISLYNGHRLPLQQGSYLLNDDLCPILSSEQTFVRQWKLAAAQNDISTAVLEQTILRSRRMVYRITGKADKFLNDLNAEIELGWSGAGQTNRLLGRITMRSYIFGHVLYADQPLNGQALIDDVVRIANELPGFKQFCGHQLDLEDRAKDWATCIEQKHYFPYGVGKAPVDKSGPSWNEKQEADARERIHNAVLDLCYQDKLPKGIGERVKAICAYKVSRQTLYNHKDLWHPTFIAERLEKALVDNPPDPPTFLEGGETASAGGAAVSPYPTSLLGAKGCNTPQDKLCSPFHTDENKADSTDGCNNPTTDTSEPIDGDCRHDDTADTHPPRHIIDNIKRALKDAQDAQQARQEAYQKRAQHSQQKKRGEAYLAQLKDWADSGDPILVAEARRLLRKLGVSEQPLASSR